MMTSFYSGKMVGLFLLVFVLAGCASAPPAEPEQELEVVVPAPAPEPEPVIEAVVEVVPEEEPDNERTYTVEQGDNLWDIAGKQDIYANPYQWPLIFKDNKSQIDDADLIFPGQVFTINMSPDMDEVGVAIEHARTRGPWRLGVIEASDSLYLSR